MLSGKCGHCRTWMGKPAGHYRCFTCKLPVA